MNAANREGIALMGVMATLIAAALSTTGAAWLLMAGVIAIALLMTLNIALEERRYRRERG